jgi:two-component system, LuxR family, sensor kinase FixL
MRTKQSRVEDNATLPTLVTSRVLPVVSAAIVIAIFLVDTITPTEMAFAVLYVGVVLLSARFLQTRGIVLASFGCMALTVLSYLLSQHLESPSTAVANCLLSLGAIGTTAFLAVENQRREMALRGQAGLLDLTHDTVFVRDMNDVITYWNRGAEELYGWKKGEAVGKITHELLQTIFPMPLEEIMAELFRTGRWEGELTHTKKGGTQAIVASRWSAQRDAQGRSIAILETNNDITERQQAERALQEALTELTHVTRVTTLGELTASIAHEVKQPVSGVIINAEAALRWLDARPPDLGEIREALGRIVRDGRRAVDVIDRIRALINKAPPRKARLDLNEAVLDVIALTRSEVLKHGVSQQTRLATSLALVEGDRIQLQQVILNLILNGVEAMSGLDEGPRELLISTEREASGGVLVTVRDSGPGLDPESVDRVFETFYTTKPEGMGMGLAICRSIVKAHEGRLWATTNEPRGAVFQFTLPPDRNETVPAERADHMPVV